MSRSLRIAGLVVLACGLLGVAAAPAHANVGKVQEILEGSGRSGVARGPKTVDDRVKAQLAEMARELADKTGARAFIVVLADGSNVDDYAKVYDKMKLNGADVLIVSAGGKWALRCNGISSSDKQRLMKQVLSGGANPLERMQRLTSAIPAALGASQAKAGSGAQRRATTATGTRNPIRTREESSGGFGFGFALLALLLIGGGGFVFWRRKQRDARLEGDLKAALDPGEQAMANIFLGMDAVEGKPGFDALLSRATDLSTGLDALKRLPPSRQTIARAETLSRQAKQLEGEFRAFGAGTGPQLLG